jgi:NAD(P)-dependent dehydrogenase (short-subunit alcohol dehydrogenase family)
MVGTADLSGKTCIVTGASNGIGKVTAGALAAMGARVVMVCRDAGRAQAARAEIARDAASDDIDVLIADLSSQEQIRSLAAQINGRYEKIDVLVNNAGAINTVRTTTVDGIETTFAVNHLAYFTLTNFLLDRIRASGAGRVVNVSSGAHVGARMDFDDLQGARRYGAMRAYGQSKLANVLFTYELARRLEGSGVTANCLHPGVVATGFGHNNPGWLKLGVTIMRPFVLDAQRGAETSIYLAASPEVRGVTGKYFEKCKEVRSSAASYDPAAAARLWEMSEEMTGVGATGVGATGVGPTGVGPTL